MDPANFAWPGSRRERIQARLTCGGLPRWVSDRKFPLAQAVDNLEVETDIVDEETA